MAAVQVGEQAPTFTAPLQDGGTFDSATLLGRKWLVLFFYPKDNTPVCTKEACAFRDSYEKFAAAGAEVVGVSSDSADSHAQFAAKHRLPFRSWPTPTVASGNSSACRTHWALSRAA
jgi:peroxiredoxin Q/BCP